MSYQHTCRPILNLNHIFQSIPLFSLFDFINLSHMPLWNYLIYYLLFIYSPIIRKFKDLVESTIILNPKLFLGYFIHPNDYAIKTNIHSLRYIIVD